jgi:hypothetical protein
MKLYTEEEIRKFFTDEYEEELSINELIERLTPIELPTDEEIYSQSQQHSLQCALENFFDEDEITIIKHHWVQGYKKAVTDFSTYGGNK